MPKLFEALDQTLYKTFLVQTIKIVLTKILISFRRPQQDVAGDQQCVLGYCDDRPFLPFTSGQTAIQDAKR